MINILKKLNQFLQLSKKQKSWKGIEYFDETWKERIAQMSQNILPGQIVTDLGCGKMWLRDYLPLNCTYIPVDYCKRSDETLVCDFNKYEFPTNSATVSFISGCLEYIIDFKWFIKSICNSTNTVILSYCTTNYYPEIKQRKSAFWVNHLSKNEIIMMFKYQKFELVKFELTPSNNSIFLFKHNGES